MNPLLSRTRTAAVVTALAAGALLAPTGSGAAAVATPARSATPSSTTPCTPDNCDFLIEYFSDAAHTMRIGELEDGPCGQIDWGQHVGYILRFQRTC